jgi:hypothetical protein
VLSYSGLSLPEAKLTLSHFQGMRLAKIVLGHQAYIRIQSLINLGRTSPVPSPSLDLSTSTLRIVSVPKDDKSITGNFAVRSHHALNENIFLQVEAVFPQDNP